MLGLTGGGRGWRVRAVYTWSLFSPPCGSLLPCTDLRLEITERKLLGNGRGSFRKVVRADVNS